MISTVKASRWDLVLLFAVAALAAAFVIAFAARPAAILTSAALDDALFIRLGRALASGHWLGGYDHTTLVKGPGFPLFLAILNLVGVPYTLGLALFHVACSGFAAFVVWRLLDSRLAGIGLFALLLFAPPFYFGDLLRVSRDFFYMSLTLALTAAAISLATGRGLSRRSAAVITGLLGGWWWLTREEGVWLVPSLAILALLPLARGNEDSGSRRPGLLGGARLLAPAGAAALVGTAVVLLVGATNWGVYGRFVVNEIKDSAFQGALQALQRAAGPHRQHRVPVPRAARARIYAASPAFATLRTPILDGPLAERYTVFGCQMDARLCGDFGGGWFMWVVRETAAANGEHASPGRAAGFYRRIASEVDRACDQGRLSCSHWNLPLIPPMEAGQATEVVRSLRRVAAVMGFSQPVWTSGLASDLSAVDAARMEAFLNRPAYESPIEHRRIGGWFVGEGTQWFQVRPLAGVRVDQFVRRDSPDLVGHFRNPDLQRQRFELEVDCPAGRACDVELQPDRGPAFRLDLASLPTGPRALGRAQLYIDTGVGEGTERYLKTRLSRAWVGFASGLNPLYRGLVLAGAMAYLVVLAGALAQRRLSVPLVVGAALAAAVAARAVILALIDALSFPAANHAYALPATALLVMFAVVALHELISALAGWRSAGPRAVARELL